MQIDMQCGQRWIRVTEEKWYHEVHHMVICYCVV